MSDNERLDGELKARVDALPRSIEPPRDLWADIAQAIAAGRTDRRRDDTVVRGNFRSVPPTPSTTRSWPRIGLLVAAGVALVTLSSAITAYLVRVPDATAPRSATGGNPAGFDTVAWEQFRAAEAEYELVTDELLAALEERRGELAPETVQTVEESLATIQASIAEAKAALERDPANARLATKLTDIYRKRVTFLKQMSRL